MVLVEHDFRSSLKGEQTLCFYGFEEESCLVLEGEEMGREERWAGHVVNINKYCADAH